MNFKKLLRSDKLKIQFCFFLFKYDNDVVFMNFEIQLKKNFDNS